MSKQKIKHMVPCHICIFVLVCFTFSNKDCIESACLCKPEQLVSVYSFVLFLIFVVSVCNPAWVPEHASYLLVVWVYMAAYINRTLSLVSGDGPGARGQSLDVGPMADARSLRDSSPLQIFVKAKKKINDIFVEIEDYVRDTVTFMQSKY